MKIVFVTNYVHHHQVPLADEFYKILSDNYKYIAVEKLPDWLIKGGYDPTITRPYIIKAYENDKVNTFQLAYEADVVIIGSAPEKYVTRRIKEGKLTFRYSERWFKSKPWYLSSLRAWISFYRRHIKYNKKPLYMLAASAYTANDVYAIGAYRNKVYKWGYFTAVSEKYEREVLERSLANTKIIPQIMWCSRFLKWKHPELPVKLASRLKANGYKFVINMYGGGEELESTKTLAHELAVEDVVSFCGNFPNKFILAEMQRHQIFLFTSDKNEGWGAVLNESMSRGCAVVASDKIGATPFLIKDGENGLIFESENINSLYERVILLLEDDELRKRISYNAYKTMCELWNPQTAAINFIKLAKSLQMGKDTSIIDGPCSKAYPFKV